MPAGVSMGQYLKFLTCAMLSMMAGAQMVHIYYKPLKDLDVYIEQELKQENLLGLLDNTAKPNAANSNNVTKSEGKSSS